MARTSIFDPESPEVERNGDRFTGPDAGQISHMPPDVVDGKVEGARDVRVPFDANGNPVSPGQAQEKSDNPG